MPDRLTPASAEPASQPTARRARRSKRSSAARTVQHRQRLRRLSRLLAALLSSLYASLAAAQIVSIAPPTNALPTGGHVVVGSGSIVQSNSQLVVNQSTARLGIDWQTFDIGSAASVEFKQPDASSIALNRVVGNSGSAIYGKLSANGQVFLTNANGVLFAPGAKVDVGGLVASTLDLSQQDFAEGRFEFKAAGASGGSIVNQGHITAQAGGYIALFGQHVANEGDLTVNAGSVLLASGRAATVSISGSGLLSAVLTPGTAGSVDNRGLIAADGGTVRLDARSAEAIASSLVNNSGVVRANSIVEHDGEIWITGDQVKTTGTISADGAGGLNGGRIVIKGDMARGSAEVGGLISARSDSGAGGSIETSAAKVVVADGAQIDTRSGAGRFGTWLIDPTDFTVAAGSGALTGSGIGADTLSTNLARGNVQLATGATGTDPGDLNVNAAVSWSANTTLTLQAAHDININADLTATGNTAGMVFTPNTAQSGGSFKINPTASTRPKVTLSGSTPTLTIAGTPYTVINSVDALQAIDGNATALGGNYALGSDIDASATASWNNGAGFNPIGNETNASSTTGSTFTGRFEGLGHSITALTINRPTSNATGLFANALSASISNVDLVQGSVTGSQYVGGLIGYSLGSTTITNVRSGALVSAVDDSNSGVYAGGLVAYATSSGTAAPVVTASTASGTVYGESPVAGSGVGGAVGYFGSGTLTDVTASGNVSNVYRGSTSHTGVTGGLVGYYYSNAVLVRGNASGNVSGGTSAGGLVGQLNSGTSGGISGSSASGQVSNTEYGGGLVGYITSGNVGTSNASGTVSAVQNTGGLVGWAGGSGSITDSSATGAVTGAVANSGNVGGLVGAATLTGGMARVQASGNVQGGYDSGGLAGQASGGAITYATASGRVQGDYNAGGLVGITSSGSTVANSSATGNVSGTGYVGGLIGQSNADISNASASGNVVGSNTTGGLAGYQNGAITASSASGTVTVTGQSTGFAGGLVGDYYGCYYCSTPYSITASHATGAVALDGPSGYAGGLVGRMQSGNIDGSTATGTVSATDRASGSSTLTNTAGGLVGYFGWYSNTGAITNSSASGAVSGNYYTGGLVGQFYGTTLTDSSASGAVTGTAYVGGLVAYGTAGGTINNVSATGKVTSTAYGYGVGGLLGQLNLGTGGLTNGFASGTVNAPTSTGYVGGLAGYVATNSASGSVGVNDNGATGAVTGGTYTGGLLGGIYLYGNTGIANSYASGSVTGNSYAGGLVGDLYGYNSGTTSDIGNSHASGAVAGGSYVGGLVGYAVAHKGIVGSYATGNVTGQNTSGAMYLGGLVGYYNNYGGSASTPATISTSYASGNVGLAPSLALSSGSVVNAGGLVGYLYGSYSGTAIANAYASGNVMLSSTLGSLNAGGLVGYDYNQLIANTYANGRVSTSGGQSHATGGLLAAASGSAGNSPVTASYWDSTSSGQAGSLGGGTALTTAQMLQSSSFSGWDIANTAAAGKTWRSYDGFTAPLLTGFLTPLTLSLADASKTYDGTKSFGNAALSSSSGPVTYPDRIFASVSAADVGSYAVGAAGVYSQQNGYDLTVTGSATLTVTPKTITLSGVVADKVYDSTRTATFSTTGQPTGLVAGEDLLVNTTGASAVFDTKNVGQNKTVTVSGVTLADGTHGKASNYTLASSTTTQASITPATLSAGSFAATNRVYDGSTTVVVTATPAGSVTGKFAGDDVSVDLTTVASGNMADKNVGTGKAVTVLGATLTGADAANYHLAGVDTVTVDITPKSLGVNGLVASNRTYNANTTVTVPIGTATLAGLVAGDQVQLSPTSVTGTMADKNVGTGKAVSVAGNSLMLRGPDAANYQVQNSTTTVDITPYTVSFYAWRVTGTDKIYDGTNTATAGVGFYYTPYSGDNVTLSYNAPTYSDKNVAYSGSTVTSKTITVTGGAISGTDAGNYVLASPTATTTGTISPKPLTVTGVTAVDRVYDATVNVSVNLSSVTVDTSAIVSGDTVTVTTPGSGTVTGTMANKNVGTNKAVTVPGFTLSGTDAGNYTLNGTSGVTVNITPKDLTASYSGIDKVYNGNAYAGVSVGSNDIIGGDTVHFYADQSYCGYPCGYAYFATAGSTPSNYTASKDAGTGKTIVVTSNGLYGTDAANYNLLNPTGNTTASITPKGITPVFNGVNKIYDGTDAAAATINIYSSGIVSGDAVTVSDTAVFATGKNVGNGKTVNVSNIALSGASASNYTLSATSTTTTANITPKTVTLTGVGATDRVYDGTAIVALASTGTLGAAGAITGDDLSVVPPSGGLTNGTMGDKNVGTAKPVTVTGVTLGGADAANYQLVSSGVSVNITPKALTASYAGSSRIYNGGVTAPVTGSSADILSGDTVTFSQSAIFSGLDGRNVGTNKPISVSNIAIAGTDAANYALQNTTATTTGGITPKGITVSYAGVDRVYDGVADRTASVVGSSSALVAGDIVTFSQSATFQGDGSAGNAKAIDISGITLSGAQAGNYSLSATTGTTSANILKRPIGATGITATNRVYDGTTVVAINTAGATIDSSAVIAGDQVSVVLPGGGISTGNVATKDAGTNKDVAVTGLTLSGSSAPNYTVIGATGLVVNITPKPLNAVYIAADKVYDGTAAASITASSADILGVDLGAIGVSASGSFSAGKNAGSGKTVAVTGGFLTGVERNNYSLVNPSDTTTATITPKSLTPVYDGGSRVYDGGTSAPVNARNTGIVSGDAVTFAQTAVFTGSGAKNVGSGKAVDVSGISIGGTDAANYTLTTTSAATTASITPKPIGIDGLTSATAVDRVYDGSTSVAVVVASSGTITPTSSDIVAGDTVAINLPSGGITTGSMANKNVGSGKAVVVDGLTLSGTDAANYSIRATNGVTVNITPKALTASYTGVDKVYDGTATASIGGSSADIINGDIVSIYGSGVFTGTGAKNVGSGKSVDVLAGHLGGVDGANYALANATGTTTASIAPRQIAPSYSGGSKVYDGTAAAPLTSNTSGFISGDDVTLSQTAVFTGGAAAKNVGVNKAVQVSGISLSGTDATNYALTGTTANTTGTITPKPLRIDGLTGVTATDRTYDATNVVAVTVTSSGPIAPNPTDLIAGDVVTVTAPPTGNTTGTMQDKNVGSNKPVAVVGLSLGGADAANYSITATSGVTVNITPKALTATYTGVDKVYDGTTAAQLATSSGDIFGGDHVTIGASGVFTTGKNVGTGKAIDVTGGVLSGTDAANYALVNTSGTATATISPKTVNVTYAGGTKVYDGTTSAPVSVSNSGLIAGDDVSVSQSAVFTGTGAKNVGDNKAVQVSAITLGGNDAGNYVLGNGSATTTASVTPRPVTIDNMTGVTAVDRVYDGTKVVAVNVTGSNSGPVAPHPGDIITGDDVTLNVPGSGITTGTMADKNIGRDKAVVVDGLGLSGTDAPNYRIVGTAGVTVNITPKVLTAVFGDGSKVYDGTPQATVASTATGIVAGDQVAINAPGVFTAGKNVGSGKAIDVQAAALTGTDAGNYTLANPSGTTTGNITPRPIDLTFAGGTRVYDGTVAAPVSIDGTSGLIAADDVHLDATAVFTGSGAKNVGTGKAVQITGVALSGADAANYALSISNTSTTGSITPRPITVAGITGITATDREYDGTRNVAVSVSGSGGVAPTSGDIISGDDVTIAGSVNGQTSGQMADKNVGTNKAVVVNGLTLSGTDAGNYLIAGIKDVTVNITPKTLQLTGVTPVDRNYDGTTQVAIVSAAGAISGSISGDDVHLLGSGVSGSMADKNVGSSKAVSIGSLALTGADAANYSVQTPDLRVNITPRTLLISATASDKIYDGTTAATVSLGDNRVQNDVLVLGSSASDFADKNAGTGKSVGVHGISLSGADAGNYQLASTDANTTAAIKPAPLTVAGNTLTKTYGDTLALAGTEFTATGLVAGETIGSVTASAPSGGLAATASVNGGPYALNVENATGGTFLATNYELTYTPGRILVTPRPLTVAADSVVRYTSSDPSTFTYATQLVGGSLVNGDTLLLPNPQPLPAATNHAPGGSVFQLAPVASFTSGDPSNYALTYQNGLLLVLPTPPTVSDNQPATGGEGQVQLTIQFSQEEIDQTNSELKTSSTLLNQRPPGSGLLPKARRFTTHEVEAVAAEAANDAGTANAVTLPALLRQPLISLDPTLRRVINGGE